MKTLTVIPDYQNTKSGEQIIWRHRNKDYINPAYLHGELHQIAGFDIVYHLESAENQVFELPDEISGELEVKVFVDKNEVKEIYDAVLVWYIYADNSYCAFRALIVDKNDKKAYDYAKIKQSELNPIL